ncbi:hypothetical protein ONS95_000552 [Cadophora gregata]|uniref:uncharacterized protein n=1 Tax=Cadophora gregata TaxID=51156 RepID=UPI0026DC0F32|nr:uncharacterized protein ONS95_000552 [Cadophora gregata]KAK0125434.1 hypothetical protein ONS96_009275 [Cadophora gregata f. sp. sojae]KAK0128588.1 hypothetical protein ONS95_000552 [Cadophora gregata]
MYWCEVCTTGALFKEQGERTPDDDIPQEFREVRRNGKRALSFAHFSKMRKSGIDSPWMLFSGKQLLDLLSFVIQKLDTGIPEACEETEGHCCIPDIATELTSSRSKLSLLLGIFRVGSGKQKAHSAWSLTESPEGIGEG